MNKVKTMKLKDKDYAKVPDRIKAFREDCPNGLIETNPTITDERIVFKTRVVKDKKDPNSAEATAHALGTLKGEKAFEKLETISVGRALAMLGYMASGEIASSEEMEEFHAYKGEKEQAMLIEAETEIAQLNSMEDLKDYWQKNQDKGKDFVKLLSIRKQELTEKQNEKAMPEVQKDDLGEQEG